MVTRTEAMEALMVQLFGYGLALGVLLSSALLLVLGRRWQRIEASLHAGDHRPRWLWLISAGVIAVYLAAVVSFFGGEQTLAGWLLVVLIPVGWAVSEGLVTLSPMGRRAAISLRTDAGWQRIALARLPVAVLLALLAYWA